MKDLLAGCVAALLVLLSAPLGAAGPAPLAVATAEAQPVLVRILAKSTTLQWGQNLVLVASVTDANGGAIPGPISYAWSETTNLLDLSPVFLGGPVFQLTGSATVGLIPGPYNFTVVATAGDQQGRASITITVPPRPTPKVPPKLNLVCDPASRTIKPGQPLTLTADLQPADGGVSSAVISYAWSVTPGLREAMPAGPSLKLGSAQTQGLKPGQAYTFTLKVKVGPFEVPASCTVTVAPPDPLLQPNRQKVPVPIPRPGVKL